MTRSARLALAYQAATEAAIGVIAFLLAYAVRFESGLIAITKGHPPFGQYLRVVPFIALVVPLMGAAYVFMQPEQFALYLFGLVAISSITVTDEIAPFGGKSVFFCEQLAVVAHAVNVPGGRTVPEFGGDGQPLDGFFAGQTQLFLAAFEPFKRLLERHRSGVYDVLKVFTVEAILNFQFAASQGVGHIDEDFVRFKRFHDIPEGPHIERGVGQNGTVEPGDHDGRGMRTFFQNIPNQIHAGFTRHVYVAQHEGIGFLVQQLPGFTRIRRQGDGVSVCLEEVADEPSDGFFVIDDQNLPVFKKGVLCVPFT